MSGNHQTLSGKSKSIPALVGIGLRSELEQSVLNELPDIGWLEVHSENYFGIGGRPETVLENIGQHYPISLHGIGMGLGNSKPLDRIHLERLKALVDAIDPLLVSEHICWNAHQRRYFSDLLPLPYRSDVAVYLAERIDEVQQCLGRQILVENISTYIEFNGSELSEQDFVLEVVHRAECKLLLDVNNVYVNAHNHQFDALGYLNEIPGDMVGEIHVAGHTRRRIHDSEILLDTHDRPVCGEVWQLYGRLVDRIGPKPTLLEYDASIPPVGELVREAKIAEHMLFDSVSQE